MIAALYVQKDGAYFGLPDVDPVGRRARRETVRRPVVSRRPSAVRQVVAARFFTEARFGLKRGDDGGCFAAALDAVRRFGGVLEHPAYSKAWDAFVTYELGGKVKAA